MKLRKEVMLNLYLTLTREVFKNMIEAKVNVLTSWIETPGLVSIAVYAGCNIVVTDKGSVRDYFHDYAIIVNQIILKV